MNFNVALLALLLWGIGLNGLMAGPLLDRIEKLPADDLWDLRACEVVYDGGSLEFKLNSQGMGEFILFDKIPVLASDPVRLFVATKLGKLESFENLDENPKACAVMVEKLAARMKVTKIDVEHRNLARLLFLIKERNGSKKGWELWAETRFENMDVKNP